MIISDDLLKRILADMRLASADKHGARRMLIHELEAAMAAGGGQEPSEEALEVAESVEQRQAKFVNEVLFDFRQTMKFARSLGAIRNNT